MKSVYQVFAETAARAGDKPFLHIPLQACRAYSDTPIDLSYGEALAGIDRLAADYREAGYGCPLRVALMLDNRADFFLHWLALNRLGCSVIPVSREMQDEEVRYFLEHGEASLLVALPDLLPRLEPLCRTLSPPMPVIDCSRTAGLAKRDQPATAPATDGDRECALLYTSGSTGKPKACILDNSYYIFAGRWYNDLDGLVSLREGRERLLTPLPLTHMNAMAVSSMAMIMSAGCLIQLDRFHPREWWQTVRDSRASIIHYLGVLPAILLDLPPDPDDDFSGQIRFGFGAGVNPRHHAVFEQRFGFPLLEAWAMTESGVGGSIIANHEPRHVGSCCFGRAPDSLEYQLVDENRQPVAPGQEGELRVRAAGEDPRRGFFSGYLKNPEATAEIWRDGWLNTGDVVREGPDGSLYFVDRRKNVIRRSGENISALEVEAALVSHPAIRQVVVTAVPDELRGDEVAAVVVIERAGTPNGDPASLAASIVEHCLAQLAYYKAPGYLLLCDELPVTASNKPRRGDIKLLARERVASGDCVDTRSMKKRQVNA